MRRPNTAMSSNLDMLRTVAVSCVFFAHLYETIIHGHAVASHHIGQLGVVLFFVHTSLVLMQALDRSSLEGQALFREFFLHRFFRIYPLSVFCVVVAYLVPGATWSVSDLVANVTLTMNLVYAESMVGGLWTLPLEVQMYLVLPILFVLLRNRAIGWTIFAGILILLLATMQPYITRRLSLIEYAPCFFGGVIAWKIGMGKGSIPAWLWPVAIICLSLPWLMVSGNGMAPRWITCISLGLAIPWFCESTSERVNAIAKTIAQYSYGIYLTHAVALKLAFGQMGEQPLILQVVVFVGLAVTLPLAAYHFIEKPMIRYGKTLVVRKAAAAIPDDGARAA